MSLSLDRGFKLAGPRGDGLLPYLNEEGAFLGDAVPLLERDEEGHWQPRSQPLLEKLLSLGYGGPVDLGWRMNRLAAVARALNKGDRSLAGIALVRLELPALPNMDCARLMAKADRLGKYDQNEPRLPSGSARGGQWTSSGNTDRGAGLAQLMSTHVDETKTKKEHFVDVHLAEAQKAADQLHTPVENILAISALESNWGTHRFATEGNNYFGMHYPTPHANGSIKATDSNVQMATYASYSDCLKDFISRYGSLIQGVQDPSTFAAILQDKAKFGINSDGTKVLDYSSRVSATARGLRQVIAGRKI